MQKNRGFTLIELLLVIAIISILVSVSIVVYRQHEMTNRIEKAALETQNFLTAAINYYNDTGKWPQPHDNALNCTSDEPNFDNFIKNYLPNQSALSAFGHYYCWSTLAEQKDIFWVGIKIPAGDFAMAKRLVALLPNAVSTSKPSRPQPVECWKGDKIECFVRVELSQAALSNNAGMNGTTLAGVGNCIPKQTTPGSSPDLNCKYIGEVGKEPKPVDYAVTFHCPENSIGNLVATPNYLYVGDTGADSLPFALLSLQATAKNCHLINSAKSNVTCTLEINASRANGQSVATGANGNVGASYTAYCSSKKKENHPFFSY